MCKILGSGERGVQLLHRCMSKSHCSLLLLLVNWPLGWPLCLHLTFLHCGQTLEIQQWRPLEFWKSTFSPRSYISGKAGRVPHICLRDPTSKNKELWDFPGGPVVKTSPSNAGGVGSIPGQGAKIPHASGPKNQNIKQKQYCNKFNKDFKIGPQQQ